MLLLLLLRLVVWIYFEIGMSLSGPWGVRACRLPFLSFPSPFFHYCWMERRNVTHYRANCSLFRIVTTTTTSTRRRRIFLNEKLDKFCDRFIVHLAFSIGDKKEEEEGKKENTLEANWSIGRRSSSRTQRERERGASFYFSLWNTFHDQERRLRLLQDDVWIRIQGDWVLKLWLVRVTTFVSRLIHSGLASFSTTTRQTTRTVPVCVGVRHRDLDWFNRGKA